MEFIMSEVITTTADGNYRVVATLADEAESPRWGAEFGTMFCDHPRYTLGDERVGILSDLDTILQEQGQRAAIQWLVAEHGATVILPLYLHDHSGLSIRAGVNLLAQDIPEFVGSAQWDTSLVGAIFDTAANRLDWVGNTEEILRREVEEYDQYLQGSVYHLTVEVKVQEVRRSAFTYPDKVTVVDSVHTHWQRADDTDCVTTYGSDEHEHIAADMLSDFVPANAE